ncbi:MAG: hypothetical protein NXH88_10070 [Hyphomonas sp.]|nr:hypothetical protein [Hyphomonas sp.]
MSKHVVSLVYSRKAGSLLRKAVLAYMADVANHDGTGVWSSKQRIADEIEASKRGVIDCIKGLVTDGVLSEVGKRKCANGYTVEYAINLDVVSELPLMSHNKGEGCKFAQVQEDHPTHAPDAPDPCTQFTQTVLNRPKPTPNGVDARETRKPPKAKKVTKRGSRIAETWAPTPTDYAHASKKGLTPQEINHEADQFRDYHIAKGTISKDWAASWRTWCRNAAKWKSERKPSTRTDRHAARDAVFDQVADQFDYGADTGRAGSEHYHPHASAGSSVGGSEATLFDTDGAQLTWDGGSSERAA